MTFILIIIALSFIIQWCMRAEINKCIRDGRGRDAMEMYTGITYQTTQFIVGICSIVGYVFMLIPLAIIGGVFRMFKN